MSQYQERATPRAQNEMQFVTTVNLHLARTQQLIDTDVHQAYKAVRGLNAQTDDLLNMLTILTNDVRAQRDKSTSNVGGVEDLMKKFGFKLSDLEVRIREREFKLDKLSCLNRIQCQSYPWQQGKRKFRSFKEV